MYILINKKILNNKQEQQLQSQKQELSRLKVSKDALSDMIRKLIKNIIF